MGKENYNKKLLVEGNDDKHVIFALCEKFSITENFDVIDCKSKESVIEKMPIYLKTSDIEIIGLIIDADCDIFDSYKSICSKLSNIGYKLPNILPKEGLILSEPDKVKIAIWIMPNNKINGMLEDFIAFLIPQDDKLPPLIDDFLNTIEEKKLNKYKPIHRAKTFIHSYLAVQEDPGTPMGLAITKRYLTTDEKNCLNLINWLKKTFRD
ncbi:MAG: hypothetical protein A2086_11360 [Spirochaetes bacterium GWD1_27_9]|nr:MAG: hypothetical protein A2Z98_07595 [Spirochaetes bacterium GWB1_27_13]OHD33051.1 MAG: hypothetical protein A2086_11360 [Spirochaetes bacterium GWD1_27_9]